MLGFSVRLVDYLQTLKSVLQLLWKCSRNKLILTVLLSFVTGLLPISNLLVISLLIDYVTNVAQRIDITYDHIYLLMFGIAALGVFEHFIRRSFETVKSLFQRQLAVYIEVQIAEKASSLDIRFFESSEFHNLLQNASNEASFRPISIIQQLTSLLLMSTTMISMLIVLIVWQVWVVGIILMCSLGSLVISLRLGGIQAQLIQSRAEVNRHTQYLKSLLIGEPAAKEVRLFDISRLLLQRYRNSLNELYMQDSRLARQRFLYGLSIESLISVLIALLITFTAIQALQQIITLGSFTLYTQTILQFQGNLNASVYMLTGLYTDGLFAKNLFSFLRLDPFEEINSRKVSSSDMTSFDTVRIEFRNVSFHYPNTNVLIVKNVSFEIKSGELIALIGKNGSGKSTIVKLLSGLYIPTEGEILFNGIDSRKIDRNVLRSLVSVIFQDFNIFQFTVRENIGFGDLSKFENQHAIKLAAEHSGFASIVDNLPNGYETVLGRSWKNGHELSGGQRQLLALARSLMRHSPIFILDEPSSALDIPTELEFFKRLVSTQRDEHNTVILISHRYTTVQRADRILVLEEGRLIEQGTHKELINLAGSYAATFNIQMQLFTGQIDEV